MIVGCRDRKKYHHVGAFLILFFKILKQNTLSRGITEAQIHYRIPERECSFFVTGECALTFVGVSL